MTDRAFDIVVYGSTGFTGKQAAAYLAKHAPKHLRWTIAGRRPDALAAVATQIGLSAQPIVADSGDPDSIAAMASATRVLITTAGPYARYGSVVVDACVKHQTHYVDITGETPWIADMIAQHHDTARQQGTRIVPSCGFDSVPSDVGARWLAAEVRSRFDQPVDSIIAAFSMHGGGLNGGTAASAVGMAEDGTMSKMQDPFLLNPSTLTGTQRQAHADPTRPVRDDTRGRWMAPFVMGPANTRVVRRSAWLDEQAGAPWGSDVHYQEYLDVPKGSKARATLIAAGMSLAGLTLNSSVGRGLFKRLAPKPGMGPSEADMDAGGFRVIYEATAEDGRTLRARMDSPGDAGNRSTVRFLCEAALTLAEHGHDIGLGQPNTGGVLTPSTALGAPYLDRLRAQGVTLAVEAPDGAPSTAV